MKRFWRARPGRYGLLAFTMLVFTACLLFSFHRIKEQHEMELRDVDVSLWLASRAEFELQRLLVALDRYALGRADVDHDDLMARFEIFWSRLPLLVEGVDSASIRSLEGAATVPEMIAQLERLEPALTALRPGDRAAYRPISDTLREFRRAPADALARRQGPGRPHSDAQRAGKHRLYLEQLGYLLGILISGSVLIGLLLRETRHVRRLLADATTARNRIWHLAHHDPLTDLPNRWLFNDRLDQALRRGQRQGETVALHYFDLDDFKAVNDGFGHLAGDRVLVAVAQRLRACVRDSDTLARLGGDEFAIVQSGTSDRTGAVLLAERMLAALNTPFAIDDQSLRISASIGIALYPDHATLARAAAPRGGPSALPGQGRRPGALQDLGTEPCGRDAARGQRLTQPQLGLFVLNVQGLPACERRQCGGFGAQRAWPEADRHHALVRPQLRPLLRIEAALGTDQQIPQAMLIERIGDRLAGSGFVADEQAMRVRPHGEPLGQRHRLVDLGQGQASALLGRLDCDADHAVAIDSVDHRAPAQHRRQARHAQLGRFLDQEFLPEPFERREHQRRSGLDLLRPRLLFDGQAAATALEQLDPGQPLAVASIEQRDRVTVAPPHDREQIVALRGARLESRIDTQRQIDIKANFGGRVIVPDH